MADIKMFIFTFENGYVGMLGADSKEDALKGTAQMQKAANARIISVEEVPEIKLTPRQCIENAFSEPGLPTVTNRTMILMSVFKEFVWNSYHCLI